MRVLDATRGAVLKAGTVITQSPAISQLITGMTMTDVPKYKAPIIRITAETVPAQAFADLAGRALDGLPLSFPGTTGVPGPTTGGRIHQARRAA
mgnify:CR=1 FL=1